MHCVVAGDVAVRPVVLLHSGLGSVADWEAMLPALTGAGFSVVAYDRWGYGRSDHRDGFAPPDFEADVDDLSGLLGALGVSRPQLVGHSDGGSIALAHAALAGDAVRSVLAVAAHAYLELKMLPGIRALQRQFEDDPGMRDKLAAKHGPRAEPMARAWFAGWLRREAWQWDMREKLAAVRCPTLVVQGLEDEYATPDHARDIAAAVAGAELELLPGVGHMVPQAVPDQFNSLAVEFAERTAVMEQDVTGGARQDAAGGVTHT